MKLSSVRLVTKDVPALAAFYQEVTGIVPAGNADFVELRTPGSSTLAICSQRSVDVSNAGALSAGANRSAVLEFQVDDVDAERSRLKASLVKLVQEPTDQPWGNRSMLFRDPDGNLINLFTPASPAR